MKVLFAVNNDNVSEAIVKKYQKEYKEILSYKNVYYFNAIYRELQKDKSYSRVVISEDLEPFANNNYDSIDKFLFEKYSNIADEIKNATNEHIEVILICADRRKKTDDILVKIYLKGIYNAILGQDRTIDEVCRLINNPRDKEKAKLYYNIQESELGEDESESSVSEAEVENIRAHYARLGKNEDKYVDSFNNIVAQYTDTQLKIIIKYLPMNVKAVLEERSPKYQQLVNTSALHDFDSKKKTNSYKEQLKNKKFEEDEDDKQDDFLSQLIKPKEMKSVVIPSTIETAKVQKIVVPTVNKPEIKQSTIDIMDNRFENHEKQVINEIQEEILGEEASKKNEKKIPDVEEVEEQKTAQKRGRGRPKKNVPAEEQEQKAKRGRGRPKKQAEETEILRENNSNNTEDIDLFNMDNNQNYEEEEVDLFSLNDVEENKDETVDLFNIEENDNKEAEIDLFNMPEESNDEISNPSITPQKQIVNNNIQEEKQNNYIAETTNSNSNFNSILTGDKKIVAFVGTTKNGTSFVVNNTAEMLASMGIETAILDMTKSKNAYYIYTDDKENLREIARNSLQNLQNGKAYGIETKKNLTVYTEIPGEETEYDLEKVLTTLVQNYSAILIDTDFDTDLEIFEKAQELYLVQTMDVLTIQPLTAFLRNLKSKGILNPEKLKIVINKSERVRSLSIRTLIGGMSCYNSPSMTYMTELFDKDNIRYCEIPFEVQNYVKYLDSLVNCSISLNGYTKQLMMALRELANMVYPLINKQSYSSMSGKKENTEPFSSQINNTLNKMRENTKKR